ncbi:MAG: tetratricopeptide repeat protein [Candidatus Krumholzibacteria bacterium]|nr:tetratricopeptide repeat protein [Candidatus Krumholzibacteria bacterium]
MFIDRFVRLLPRNNLKKALAYFNTGDYRKASREFEAHLERLGEEGASRDQELLRMYMVESYFEYSRKLEKDGDLASAAAELEKAVALQPAYADIHYGLGRLYESIGRRSNSRESLKRSLALNPAYFKARVMLARSWWFDGKNDRACSELAEGMTAAPTFFIENVRDLIGVLRTDPASDEAAELFRRLLEERPSSAQISKQLSLESIQNGDYDFALAELCKAISMHPNYPDLHNLLGIAYANTGMTDDAIIEFETALKIHPDYLKARLNLALSLYEKGAIEESRRQLDRVLDADPQNELAKNLLHELSPTTSAR